MVRNDHAALVGEDVRGRIGHRHTNTFKWRRYEWVGSGVPMQIKRLTPTVQDCKWKETES